MLIIAVDTSFSVAESIQARNAIMILKTLDAKNRLNSTKKAAVMAGSGHAYDMSPLLESEDLCKETVRNFIQKQLSILKPYLADLDVSHEAILHDIKKEIARVRIYRATDRDHTKPYEEGASEVVTISDEFESDRILDALQDISLD